MQWNLCNRKNVIGFMTVNIVSGILVKVAEPYTTYKSSL